MCSHNVWGMENPKMKNRGVIGKKALETESMAATGNTVSFVMMTIKEMATMGQKPLKTQCDPPLPYLIVSRSQAW